MTRHRSVKRLVRARMEKTGESYTAARARLLAAEEPTEVAEPKITSGRSERRDVPEEGRARIVGLLGPRTRLGVRTGGTLGAEARSCQPRDLPLSRRRFPDEPVLVGGCVRVQRSGASLGFVACHGSSVEEGPEEFVSLGGLGMIAAC